METDGRLSELTNGILVSMQNDVEPTNCSYKEKN